MFIAGRNRQRGDALVAEINAAHPDKARFVELDVVNQDQWDAAVAQVKEQAGGLHVLMNIVGSNSSCWTPRTRPSTSSTSSSNTSAESPSQRFCSDNSS